MSAQSSVPATSREPYDAIVATTDDFCREYLNEEYADLARKLTAALARKRPTPLWQGSIASWACAILYTLGRVNFLFDRSQEPFMMAEQLCHVFGVSKSGAAAKSKRVMEMLKIGPVDPKWSLPSRLADHPTAWLVELDGIIVDARWLPEPLQQNAFKKGLIPYVPKATAIATRK